MVKSCSAYNCRNRGYTDNRSFHRFPTNIALRQKWIAATKRRNFNPGKFAFICSEHFKKEDYRDGLDQPRLKSDAVPSIFNLPSDLQKQETYRKTSKTKSSKVGDTIGDCDDSDTGKIESPKSSTIGTNEENDIEETKIFVEKFEQIDSYGENDHNKNAESQDFLKKFEKADTDEFQSLQQKNTENDVYVVIKREQCATEEQKNTENDTFLVKSEAGDTDDRSLHEKDTEDEDFPVKLEERNPDESRSFQPMASYENENVNDIQSASKKRISQPMYRYLGDFTEEDMNCPEKAKIMFRIAKETVTKKNKELDCYRKKMFRLQSKVKSFNSQMKSSQKSNKMSKYADSDPHGI